MVDLLTFITASVLILQAFIGLSYFVSSMWEKETRASIFAGLQFLFMLVPVVIFFFLILSTRFFETGLGVAALIAGLVIVALAAFFLVRRSGTDPKALEGTKGLIVGDVKRQDERGIVFARNDHLKPGTDEYREFYEKHPDLEENDAKRRQMGLGALGSAQGSIDKPYEEPNVAVVTATAVTAHNLAAPYTVKPRSFLPLREKLTPLPEKSTERIKGYAKYLGADLVGITEINPLWTYSHRGMAGAPEYGQKIEVDHKYAIVFAVEMTQELVRTAPHTSMTIETMDNYARGARISTQLAAFIANLGYSATANFVFHYETLLAPLAVDAGLGQVGRLGYLMTREFGPRLRLAGITTDLPLIPDKPVDIGVEDFCKICKKCAVCCPSGSILHGDPGVFNGTQRWKLNAETCFEYWAKIGSDCNICMRVCPWSHARTFPHRFIAWMITRNKMSRRLFYYMDDLFYGKKPRPNVPPKWAEFRSGLT
jgi:hypothetical protein